MELRRYARVLSGERPKNIGYKDDRNKGYDRTAERDNAVRPPASQKQSACEEDSEDDQVVPKETREVEHVVICLKKRRVEGLDRFWAPESRYQRYCELE
jgi:hypothetical protein